MMLFGLGNLFYGETAARSGGLEPSLMFPQYRSSLSMLLPYCRRIDFWREVSLPFALGSGRGLLGSGVANQRQLDGVIHLPNRPSGDPVMLRA